MDHLILLFLIHPSFISKHLLLIVECLTVKRYNLVNLTCALHKIYLTTFLDTRKVVFFLITRGSIYIYGVVALSIENVHKHIYEMEKTVVLLIELVLLQFGKLSKCLTTSFQQFCCLRSEPFQT